MICDKCGGNTGPDKKCVLCGFDNSAVDYRPVDQIALEPKSMTAIKVIMTINIILNIIMIISSMTLLFGEAKPVAKIIGVIYIIFCIFEISIAYSIIKLKKWARDLYVGLSIASIVLLLLKLDIFTVLARVAVLLLLFHDKWEYFK